MGSLGTDVDVSKITYKNVYTWSSNQMYMVGNSTRHFTRSAANAPLFRSSPTEAVELSTALFLKTSLATATRTRSTLINTGAAWTQTAAMVFSYRSMPHHHRFLYANTLTSHLASKSPTGLELAQTATSVARSKSCVRTALHAQASTSLTSPSGPNPATASGTPARAHTPALTKHLSVCRRARQETPTLQPRPP